MISDNLTPGKFSDQQAASFINQSSVKGRKERGQFFTPLPVGNFNDTDGKKDAKSYYGCYDMSGNVWEWTSSIYSGVYPVVRGGDWYYYAALCKVTNRSSYDPSSRRSGSVGFRLVLDF